MKKNFRILCLVLALLQQHVFACDNLLKNGDGSQGTADWGRTGAAPDSRTQSSWMPAVKTGTSACGGLPYCFSVGSSGTSKGITKYPYLPGKKTVTIKYLARTLASSATRGYPWVAVQFLYPKSQSVQSGTYVHAKAKDTSSLYGPQWKEVSETFNVPTLYNYDELSVSLRRDNADTPGNEAQIAYVYVAFDVHTELALCPEFDMSKRQWIECTTTTTTTTTTPMRCDKIGAFKEGITLLGVLSDCKLDVEMQAGSTCNVKCDDAKGYMGGIGTYVCPNQGGAPTTTLRCTTTTTAAPTTTTTATTDGASTSTTTTNPAATTATTTKPTTATSTTTAAGVTVTATDAVTAPTTLNIPTVSTTATPATSAGLSAGSSVLASLMALVAFAVASYQI